jgi:hypothetical protein
MRRILTVLAGLAAVAAALFLGLHVGRSGSPAGGPADSSTPASDASAVPSGEERRLAAALRRGVDRAAALGGSVEAAAMTDRTPNPIVATSELRGPNRYMRMWSMSKVATMVALLRALKWGDRPGEATSAEVEAALRGAITRSENCRQRRVVLELQRAAGGIAAARRAMAEVFTLAGAQPRIDTEIEAPEPHCVPYLQSQREIPDPLAPALLLGTSTWRVTDAVRLAHALATDAYGAAISARVLGLMSAPKQPSRESPPGELTAPLDWGAGVAFAGLDPAFKAGWGGSMNGNFLGGQLAVVPIGANDHLAIAVMFHSEAQPSRDDPGITAAPGALQAVMEAVRASLPSR